MYYLSRNFNTLHAAEITMVLDVEQPPYLIVPGFHPLLGLLMLSAWNTMIQRQGK